LNNGLWGAQYELDTIETPDFRDPVVQVQYASSRDVIYTLRINGTSFTSKVRKPGTYNVLACDPDGFYRKVKNGVKARRIDLA
jgi:NAD(P)H-flavin reductase